MRLGHSFVWITVLSMISGCDPFRLPEAEEEPDSSFSSSGLGDGPTLARFEICNNGIDDDQNGSIDDGCVCRVGATQNCYPGWPETAGVGACGFGEQTCVARGSIGAWANVCTGAIAPGVETCDDGFDDDCDGAIDEGCSCTLGAEQPCFTGPAARADIGTCASGLQHCVEGPELEGVPSGIWGACEGSVEPTAERCNGEDDDCDGAVDDIRELCDLVDNDCDATIDEGDACAALSAAAVLTRYWPPSGSGVLPGTAQLFVMRESAPEDCSAPNVRVEVRPGEILCVSPPPRDCPEGTRYDWVDGSWACVRCELLVQFGGLFDYERTCAPAPDILCPAGQVPTYGAETRAWECIPECDNGSYDRAYHEGTLVCVPC